MENDPISASTWVGQGRETTQIQHSLEIYPIPMHPSRLKVTLKHLTMACEGCQIIFISFEGFYHLSSLSRSMWWSYTSLLSKYIMTGERLLRSCSAWKPDHCLYNLPVSIFVECLGMECKRLPKCTYMLWSMSHSVLSMAGNELLYFSHITGLRIGESLIRLRYLIDQSLHNTHAVF